MAKKKPTNPDRQDALRTILLNSRREAVQEIQSKLARMRSSEEHGSRYVSDGGISDLGDESDLELTLVQITSDRLNAIDAALGRLERGIYGHCVECGDEISENRLEALPFAVRCKDCEEEREAAHNRGRRSGYQPSLDVQEAGLD